MMPPPTPKNAEKTPAARPMATRRTRRIVRAWSVGSCLAAIARRRSRERRLSSSRRAYSLRAGPRCSSCDTTDGCVRARAAAATGSRSRTARERAAPTACDDARCYVARAVDASGRAVGDIPEGVARSRRDRCAAATISASSLVTAVYARRGRRQPSSGGYYRVFDNGIRCVRAPCFSYTATQVNGIDSHDGLGRRPRRIRAPARARSRAPRRRSRTKDGLYARGRFARTPDGGRVFRALRLYLRAPLPRA